MSNLSSVQRLHEQPPTSNKVSFDDSKWTFVSQATFWPLPQPGMRFLVGFRFGRHVMWPLGLDAPNSKTKKKTRLFELRTLFWEWAFPCWIKTTVNKKHKSCVTEHESIKHACVFSQHGVIRMCFFSFGKAHISNIAHLFSKQPRRLRLKNPEKHKFSKQAPSCVHGVFYHWRHHCENGPRAPFFGS